MNFTQLQNEVIARTGRSDKSTEIGVAINLALKEISKQHFFRDLITENDLSYVADAASVTLPATTRAVFEARWIDGTASYPILIKPKKWITDRYPSISSLNATKPIYAYVEGGKLYLCPEGSESKTITVTVMTIPADIASTTANPITGSDEAVICWASMYTYAMVEDPEMSLFWEKRYVIALSNLIRGDRDDKVENVAEEFQYMAQPLQSRPARADRYLDPFDKGD